MARFVGKALKGMTVEHVLGGPKMYCLDYKEDKQTYLCRYWSEVRGHFVEESFKREEIFTTRVGIEQ